MQLVADKPAQDVHVVVAMSGGVDSSAVAAMLHHQGYRVTGVTLRLYENDVKAVGSCCTGIDIDDARRVAARLDIPHYVLDYESRFRQAVIDDFADSYLRGETPLPCVRCNQSVKFSDLLKVAQDLGADCLATGHYLCRKVQGGRVRLYRAVDSTRDQSYFLFATTPKQMDYLRFPLGEYSKEETRKLARKFGLDTADKKDSQDICFVAGEHYTDVIRRLRPGSDRPGEIVDRDGNILGQHRGLIHYTIGQRRGLEIGGQAEPLHVLKLDPATSRIIVGPASALKSSAAQLKEVNWLGDRPLQPGDTTIPLKVKLRSTAPVCDARIKIGGDNRVMLQLDQPQNAVTPGQAAVFYGEDDRLLGGGWISQAIP